MKPRMAWMIGLLLVFCCPYQDSVKSCAFPMYEDSRDVFFYFFDPGLALDARLRPLSFAGLPADTPPWDSSADAKKDNLEAWQKHLRGRFTVAETESVVYQAPLADLQAAAVPGAARAVPAVLRRFAASAEDLAYMVYAKRCEPLVAPPENFDPWDAKDWHDRPAMTAMLEEGRKLRQQATSPFIKDRYAFQVVRLAHYAGQYDRAVTLFDEYFPGSPRRDTVYYWSLALKAGALKRLGRVAESAYLFSLVFERCRSKRSEAYRGFGIGSDEAYQQCLKLCRDARERSVVLFLHGLDFDNSALEEMAAIYRELPDSPHLEVLLTREIARLERKLHGASFNERVPMWDGRQLRDPDDVFHGNLERLEAFLRQAVDEGRVKRADFWRLALGYSRYLGGNYAPAREAFLALRDGKATTTAVRQQAETFLWLAGVVELKSVDRESEARLFNECRRIRGHFPRYRSNEFNASSYSRQPWRENPVEGANEDEEARNDPKIRFLRSVLLRLYEKQGDVVRNFLADEFQPGGPEPPGETTAVNGKWVLESNARRIERIDGLIAFVARKDRDEFEDFLLKGKYLIWWPAAGVARLLAEQKGMLLMRRCLWAEAARVLPPAVDANAERSSLPDACAEYPLNPWGGYAEPRPTAAEMLGFARRMAALTRQADNKADPAVYYRLGCALFNVSYFGPAWQLLAFERSPSGDNDPDTTAFLLKEAARRFAQAERSARDKELAARACFRQADIALKLYIFTETFEKALQEQPWGPPSGKYFNEYYGREFLVLRTFANPHFPRLKQQYAATAYYRQVIRECKLFEYYVGRH
jgi:hypothetical protein